MSNTFAVSRAHLVYGVCLPLAVVIGYLLAEPLESGSVAVVVLVVTILSIPLMMRWHHPMLIFSINALILPYFLPGRPPLWMLMAVLSLFFSILDRSVGRDIKFFQERSVAYPLIFLGIVVLATAALTGGIGLNAFGSSNIGGRKYISILLGIGTYFAISCRPTPPNKVWLYVGLFFLSGLTALASYAGAMGGPFYFLLEFFPIDTGLQESATPGGVLGPEVITRWGTLQLPASAISSYLLARYGAKGVMELRKPWRWILFAGSLVLCTLGGFRSSLALFVMLFVVLFYLEKLYETRYLIGLGLATVLACAVILPNVRSMPLAVQRTLSFLPINVDPVAAQDAEGSTRWRIEIWQRVMKDVPKYLIKGKGYSMNPEELMMLLSVHGDNSLLTQEGAVLSGDYHNGPLSVIIPFGLFGAFGFLWFLFASIKLLYRNYISGTPDLLNANRFLFGLFVVKTAEFFLIFGAIHSDLPVMAAIVGLSVSINGARESAKPEAVEDVLEEPLIAEI